MAPPRTRTSRKVSEAARARKKSSSYHEKNEEEKIQNSKSLNFQEKVFEKTVQDQDSSPPEKEELKAELMESFANKKKLGLRVNVKKFYMNETKQIEELNSSDKIGMVIKKKSVEGFINNHPFRNLIFSPSVTESTFKRHLTITYRGLVYARKCLKGPSESYIRAKQVNLVDSKSKTDE